MKQVLSNTSITNKWLISTLGLVFLAAYVVLLYYRPQVSWCDDAFWSDWGRQLGLYNRYYTTVWGSGHPSYSPLYAFVLGGWFKVFGFSFFSAHIPNVIFFLICYFLLAFGLTERKLVSNPIVVVGFTMLFWWGPTLFWIVNCGRMEVLCLLLAICTIYSFIRNIEKPSLCGGVSLFISGFLLFATAVEGVVFATLVILVYSIFHFREAIKAYVNYVIHFGSYVFSLIVVSFIAWYNDCLHQFYDTMFGFSNTFTAFYRLIRAWVKNAKNGEMLDTFQSSNITRTPFMQLLEEGLLSNIEYMAIALLVVSAFVYLLWRLKWKNVPVELKISIVLTIIIPIVYVIAGRYPIYYTWGAYVCGILALAICFSSFKYAITKIVPIIGLLLWFVINPSMRSRYGVFDPTRSVDSKNLSDIATANLDPNIPVCIPYEWYYYVVDWNENIYFQASGAHPNDLSKIIYSPTDYNEEKFMNKYELKETQRIGNKIVYEIVGLKL